MRRQRRQRGGYDLDLDAVIDAHIATATGRSAPDAVYIDNLRVRRELSVLVVLDSSRSGDELDSRGSLLYERQRDGAAALIDTLAILGERVAGYAFRSHGREIEFITVKGFDENLGEHQMARLGQLEPAGYTRLGAAIRHAAHLLTTDKSTPHRVLVFITDGFPYDTAYEGSYAEADARAALSEARASGIGCLALNFASATDAAVLKRVFGTALHATAPDIDELAPAMPRLLLEALQAARAAVPRAKESPTTKE
jgi:nitric oxide reductase activation protein